LSADIFGFRQYQWSFANMTSESDTVQSFMAALNLNPDKIPKLSVATAYYQRNNDRNPFDFANPSLNTVWVIGWVMKSAKGECYLDFVNSIVMTVLENLSLLNNYHRNSV
jgi:hypothetical protein